MTVLAFDTLKAATRLREAGFDEKQAHEFVSTFAESMGANLATKDDLAREAGVLRSDLGKMETTLRSEMRELEQRMTIKLGGLMVAGITVMTKSLCVDCNHHPSQRP